MVLCNQKAQDKQQVKTAIQLYCYLLQLLYTGTANQTPGQDLVPVRDNPAYQVVNLNRTDHNGSKHFNTHEVSPQYENIEGVDIVKDFKNVHEYENIQQ